MNIINELTSNKPLWTAVLSWAIAQIIKFIICVVKNDKFDPFIFISSGGMPSSHSSFVCALSTAVGIHEGFDSPLFAVSTVISLIVMYDAAGVRRAAGNHAKIINQILQKSESYIEIDKKLKELLGHTPVEVFAGALLGIAVAFITYGMTRGV